MRKWRVTPIGAAFVALVLLVLLFVLRGALHRPAHVVLPKETSSTEDSGLSLDDNSAGRVTVRPDTVQSAVATLARPACYTRSITIERYYTGGSGVDRSTVSVDGAWMRTDTEEASGELSHTVTNGEKTWLWYGSGREYFESAASFTADEEQGIPFAAVTCAIFAGLAFPLMFSCLLRLRMMPAIGMLQVFLPLAISFGSDTFALFAGMLCGKHKLAPKVSPKKTVEGAIGGLLGGVIGMTVFKLVADSMAHTLTVYLPIEMAAGPQISWGAVFALGIIGSTISQIGDLSFSVIKREFGVKDYGNLLPGHGGILDRFDSVTFVAPFVWLALQLL